MAQNELDGRLEIEFKQERTPNDVVHFGGPQVIALLSIAISLKRIADELALLRNAPIETDEDIPFPNGNE